MTIATITGTGPERRPACDGAARRAACRRAIGRALPPAEAAAPGHAAPAAPCFQPEASHG